MSTWTKSKTPVRPNTSALIASFDRNGPAYAPATNPADLRPMRTGSKSSLFSRYSAPQAEVLEAERLIRAQRAQTLIVDMGPNALVRELVNTL